MRRTTTDLADSWRALRALDTNRRRLVLEAAVVMTSIRLGLLLVRFGRLRQVLERWTRGGSRRPSLPVTEIAWAVHAVGTRLVGERTCLVEALAADLMLRRRGYRSEVHLGVRRANGFTLDGHAWVECEGAVVVGALDRLEDYKRLFSADASRE